MVGSRSSERQFALILNNKPTHIGCYDEKSKWFAENGWTSRFCGRNLKFVKCNGRKLMP
jgi:hypothetical protein